MHLWPEKRPERRPGEPLSPLRTLPPCRGGEAQYPQGEAKSRGHKVGPNTGRQPPPVRWTLSLEKFKGGLECAVKAVTRSVLPELHYK